MSCTSRSEPPAGEFCLWVARTPWSGPFHAPAGSPGPWLSAPERAEWAGFATRKRADEFGAGRALLRCALAASGFPAGSLTVTRSRHRAPRIAGAAGTAAPAFSICHCGGIGGPGWTLVLLGPRGSRVGVDAEPVASPPSPAVLPVIAVGLELRELLGGGGPARLRAWVVKECVQKALGLGMHLDPRRIDSHTNPVRSGRRAVAVHLLELDGLLVAVGVSPPRPLGQLSLQTCFNLEVPQNDVRRRLTCASDVCCSV